jgi:DNA repair exonuclease SbcCD ATPase subunit
MKRTSIIMTVIAVAVVATTLPVGAQQANQAEQQQEISRESVAATLTQADSERIASKCKSSQKVIKNIADKFNQVSVKRIGKYNELTAKLSSISSRLQAKDIDTTQLDESIKETQALIDEFVVTMEVQKVQLSGLVDADCQGDVAGFKTGIETAKQLRQEMRQASQVIRDKVKNDIKLELQTIRQSLETQPDTTTTDTPIDPNTTVTNEDAQ